MQFDSLNLIIDTPLFAAGGIAAEPFGIGFLTNSIFVALIVTTLILLFCRMATKKMSTVPGTKQNFVEFVVEFLYGQVEGIVGPKVAKRAFPLLATIFVYILASNWFGLIPGVGTIGFGPKSAFMTIDTEALHGDYPKEDKSAKGAGVAAPEGALAAASADLQGHGGDAAKADHPEGEGHHADKPHFTPLLRPATADLNMTLGLAVVFMVVWFYITMREAGPKEFFLHMFGPKGGLEGLMKYALMPIFAFVGLIEVVSIVFRPVSLSLRLLGNVYAGETLLHTMGELGKNFPNWLSMITKVVFPLPFYFLELLVGVIQACVFALLCAVYIQLSTSHDEEESH